MQHLYQPLLSQPMRIERDFKFDAAHFLPSHPAQCCRLHGHTYHLKIILESTQLNSQGMLIDFGEIKEIYDNTLKPLFDHKTLLAENNPIYKVNVHGNRVNLKPRNPSSTNTFVDYCFPESNVSILPLSNTTAEEMTFFIHDTLSKLPNLSSFIIRISLTEGGAGTITYPSQ